MQKYESQQRFDQVQLLSVFAGKDGGLLVVFHEFIHGVEPALANTVRSVRQLHFKVLILTNCLQRHREITGLEAKNERKCGYKQCLTKNSCKEI